MTQNDNPTPVPQGTLAEIADVDQLVRAVVHWHTNKVATVNHMKSIPEGTEVTPEGGETIMLTGDALKGFQLGLAVALSELGTLPFVFAVEDENGNTGEAPASPPVGSSLN